MISQKRLDDAKQVELNFANQYLKDFVFATREQDIFEHWDVKGVLFGNEYKFDIKSLKRNSRNDKSPKNYSTWIEGTNVIGNKGWIKGDADYIVFERIENWLLINRNDLFNWTMKKLEENNFEKVKGFYKIYQRQNQKDKITLIRYADIPADMKMYLIKY